MCDTAVALLPEGRLLFAKNSDRDPNEAQVLEWHPGRLHEAGETLRCSHLSVPQVRETLPVVISRPFWLWGAEIGANAAGLVIGNEAVFARERPPEDGLTGMDLLRLALERCETAEAAVETLVALMETHGQGGRCGHEDPGFRYFSLFVIADPGGAIVLETGPEGRWVAERQTRSCAISNRYEHPEMTRFKEPIQTHFARSARRRQRMLDGARAARHAGDMMQALRDHGTRGYSPITGRFDGPCGHFGGYATGVQTTASWVSELGPDGVRHWATGTAAPCMSLFKPVEVDTPVDIGPPPTDIYDSESLWWRHEWVHRALLGDPELRAALMVERDQLELRWLAERPSPPDAFAEGSRMLDAWTHAVRTRRGAPDRRPHLERLLWWVRDRRAGVR